jgi:predicted dithiol-disulfide oxidoreductase (DUF899 family)
MSSRKDRSAMPGRLPMPTVVSLNEWLEAREVLLAKEKAATKLLDSLAAQRRRLPMVIVDKVYEFVGAQGKRSLLELFEGRRQLIVYHFMFGPDWSAPCPGCSRRMDDMGTLHHLHARNTSFVSVARAPFSKLSALCERKGWTIPFVSSHGSDFNADMGVTTNDGEDFGLSVFFRDDDNRVYRSYFTSGRGVEPAGFRQLLDMTPYGRQEEWEDSPKGWPQSLTHGWGSERDE